MKQYLKPTGVLAASALLMGALSQSAQANTISPGAIVLGTPGTSVLSTSFGPVGDYLSVNWEVTLSAGVYTYDYSISNPITDTDFVESFAVTIGNLPIGSVFSAVGGTSASISTSGGFVTGVTWDFADTYGGQTSSTLSFKSTIPPIYGAGNALDTAPPSPWSTLSPTGTPVPVPGVTVPDGGLTVALLGGALIGLRAISRKK